MSSSKSRQIPGQAAPVPEPKDIEESFGLDLYAKRENRYEKKSEHAKDTEGFVANIEGSLAKLMQLLQANIKDFPDSTRFQVAIVWYCEPNPHWLITDFFIKAGKLYTLTMDGAVTKEIFDDFKLPQFYATAFPDGEHYFYYSQPKLTKTQEDPITKIQANKNIKIQADQVYCKIFTMDFGDKISKIPPISLYQSLREHTHQFDEKTSQPKYFGILDLPDMPMLASLFMHMQYAQLIDEMKKSEKFATFYHHIISSKEGRRTFGEHTMKTMDREEKFLKTGRTNWTSIERQADSFHRRHLKLKYINPDRVAKKINPKYLEGFYRDHSGLGFVSTPIMAHLMLELVKKEKTDLASFTTELLNFLKSHKLPIVSSCFGLFKERPHDIKQNAILNMVEEVELKIKDDQYNSGKVARMLNDIVLNYAGYLVSHGLIDTHQDLKEFLGSQLQLTEKKEEKSTGTVSLSLTPPSSDA